MILCRFFMSWAWQCSMAGPKPTSKLQRNLFCKLSKVKLFPVTYTKSSYITRKKKKFLNQKNGKSLMHYSVSTKRGFAWVPEFLRLTCILRENLPGKTMFVEKLDFQTTSVVKMCQILGTKRCAVSQVLQKIPFWKGFWCPQFSR